MHKIIGCLVIIACTTAGAMAQRNLKPVVDQAAQAIEAKVIAWRRDFHQNPELGNQEFRTAKIVADHLRKLGYDVKENVAVTGVVAVLKGGKPGPVVALRADMDGLPVTERVDLPFKSTVVTEFNNQKTGVMHACGHDSHVAMLMGVAEVLAGIQKDLAGTVKLIFQPAEEGVYDGSTFGANRMVIEGVLDNPKVDAIFGLHINSLTEVGKIRYRPGATMAAVDQLSIKLKGKQTHGASPWFGVDPIVTASQIIMGLQTIISRNVNITENPAVVTVGAIHGGIRHNIIPETVEMIGTIRTFGDRQQELVHRRIREVSSNIAESAGANADVKIDIGYPSTINDEALTDRMIPTLEALAGKENVVITPVQTGAEDFSYFQKKIPGFFFFLGGLPKGKSPYDAAPHHTPDFFIDESGFLLGIKSLSHLVLDYLEPSTQTTQGTTKTKKASK